MEKEIYLAGGCFWGTERYLSLLPGVVLTQVGYANGKTLHPTYEQVCNGDTGHTETVRVVYDDTKVMLSELLSWFYESIDPTAVNRQDNDVGEQYRTGVYYTDPYELPIIEVSARELQRQYEKPLAMEILPLDRFFPGEEYHQRYLVKNPQGYCHISPDMFVKAKEKRSGLNQGPVFTKKSQEELRESLTDIQYHVTQEEGTEPPFENLYDKEFRSGIYVDITTGQPLFSSRDKFDAGCGWPSFSKPVAGDLLAERSDTRYGMVRTEVRSKLGDSHLGHVFPDGPMESGGLRYCMNSASLLFIPKEEMEQKGYGAYLKLVEEEK